MEQLSLRKRNYCNGLSLLHPFLKLSNLLIFICLPDKIFILCISLWLVLQVGVNVRRILLIGTRPGSWELVKSYKMHLSWRNFHQRQRSSIKNFIAHEHKVKFGKHVSSQIFHLWMTKKVCKYGLYLNIFFFPATVQYIHSGACTKI